MNRRLVLSLLFLTMFLHGCGNAVQEGDPDRGRTLYNEPTLGDGDVPGCISCHSITPGEVIVGPSHAGIGQQADEVIRSSDYPGQARSPEDFLRESITEPDVYVEQGFQAGIMYPNYSEKLSASEIGDLVAYLMTLR
jgi:mono/diheme cytochrome c family protein